MICGKCQQGGLQESVSSERTATVLVFMVLFEKMNFWGRGNNIRLSPATFYNDRYIVPQGYVLLNVLFSIVACTHKAAVSYIVVGCYHDRPPLLGTAVLL
jgi:hypothetical protein